RALRAAPIGAAGRAHHALAHRAGDALLLHLLPLAAGAGRGALRPTPLRRVRAVRGGAHDLLPAELRRVRAGAGDRSPLLPGLALPRTAGGAVAHAVPRGADAHAVLRPGLLPVGTHRGNADGAAL